MTDRELLELAAKAVGLEKDDSPYNGGGSGNGGFDSMGNMVLDWHNNEHWNPLVDDGDALRLAVKLKMSVEVYYDTTIVTTYDCEPARQHHEDDPYTTTRRAIVRAAAEIGKGMK